MKQILVSVFAFVSIAGGTLFGQTDQQNLLKYWKLRNDFREKFVKIGPNNGESLPARSLRPEECIDNVTQFGGQPFGEMKWGDGMIRHGYYLGLLATEYRLLKDAGQDVSGVLNELYYALNAVNRLDYYAEQKQGLTYNADFDPSLNGFYMREDVPEDFAQDNWGNTELEARCVNSPHYRTNNAAHLNEPWNNYIASGNSYQNSPSSDQFSSLIVGFSLIHKLVEPTEFVQPPGMENGFYIVGETQAIVHRMVMYLQQHNWMMIDVNGWPVNNGGGDVSWAVYPIITAAERITGQTYNDFWKRRLVGFHLKNIQYCITGYGLKDATPEGRADACDEINIWDLDQQAAYVDLYDGAPASIVNCQSQSVYQDWQLGIGSLGKPLDLDEEEVWTGSIPDLIDDVTDDGKLSGLASPFNNIDFFKDLQENYGSVDASSVIILTNYGVASGLWSGTTMNQLSQITGNIQLELINAIIRSEAAPNSKGYYQQYLDGMSILGPYNLTQRHYCSDDSHFTVNEPSPNGWGSEHRWTWTSSAYGDGNTETSGIYPGLDYMLFHNLYYLKFGTGLPKFQPTNDCFCEQIPQVDGSLPEDPPAFLCLNQANYQVTAIQLNQKLQNHLSACSKNVFTPVSNSVSSTFNVEPFFPNYADMNIFPAKFQTENATITSTGTVNVRTIFKICNTKTLTIQTGGKMYVQKGSVDFRYNSHVDNSGTIEVKAGTTFTVGAQATLKLRAGAVLDIEENATVIIEPGAELQYWGGATIYMRGPNSKILFGGSMRVMDGGEFSIVHLGTSAGKIIVNGLEVGLNTATPNVGKYKFVGKGKNDPLFIFQPDCKLWVTNNNAQSITIQQCNIQFDANSAIECNQPLYTGQVTLTASATNRGLTTTEGALIQSTDFTNVPVFAKMNIENKGTFDATNSMFTANDVNLNPADQALIKVEGRGYNLSACNLYTAKNYGLYSQNLTLASVFTGGSVQYFSGAIPANHGLTGIYDNSTAEVSVKSSTITKCNTGVLKHAGKLTLRCNLFTANKDINVNPRSSCLLNMNSTTLGGYNQLFKTTYNKNIYLNSANLDIKTGYNFIEAIVGSTITGATNSYCTTCAVLDYSGNQWVTSGKVPSNLGTVSSLAGTVYTYNTTPTALWQTCPAGGGGTPGGGLAGRSTVATENSSMVYSAVLNDSIPADQLIYMATSYMTQHNDSTPGQDLMAVDLLHDYFLSEPDLSDSSTNAWSWFAFQEMKAALESSFGDELLFMENNTVSFDTEVMKYVHALEYMSAPTIDGENYIRQFYHEIDKAHLLRMIGHSDIGLNILTELESCGLDSAEQAHLNYWKQQFETDLVIEQIGLAALDTTIVIDTTGYLNPALVSNGYSFGAIINDLNNIQYPNCDFYAYRDLVSIINGMQVFPNPATEEVRISWNVSEVAGNGKLIITQTDGRVVYEATTLSEESGKRIAISDWKPGAYLVRYTDPSGKVYVKQLVVQ